MKKRIIIAFYLLSVFTSLLGQDMQFSQFYAAPLYINPGLTGSTIEHRMIMNYRHQWPNIPGGFDAYHFSYEYNAAEINSGFGIMFNREDVGSFALTSNILAVSYAYRFQIRRNLFIQPGIKFGYAFRSVNYAKLIFNDQLETGSPITGDQDAFSDNNVVSYPDISTGGILYSSDYWFGASISHINEPNQSLIDGGDVSVLPMKFSVHGGFKFKLKNARIIKRLAAQDITVALNYKSQGLYDQFDIGAYYNHEPFVFGFWYRGIPGLKAYAPGFNNNDAVVLLVGYRIPDRNFSIGYSYDLTISRLVSDSGGAHEISIIYEAASRRKKRRSRKFIVPCAKF